MPPTVSAVLVTYCLKNCSCNICLMKGIEINHVELILHFLNQITVFWSGMYIIFASLWMMAARGPELPTDRLSHRHHTADWLNDMLILDRVFASLSLTALSLSLTTNHCS